MTLTISFTDSPSDDERAILDTIAATTARLAGATETTTANPPNAPAGITASAGSPGTSVVALSWTACLVDGSHDAAASYTVQFQPAAGGHWTSFGAPTAGTSVSVTGLASWSTYNFQVIATNSGGVATSSVASAATLVAAPNAPAGVTASAGSPAASVVALSWTASLVDGSHDAAASYTVQFQPAAGGGWTSFGAPIPGTSVSVPSVSVTGLASSTAYNFQVIATNSGGTAASLAASATTLAAAPNVPIELAAGTLLAITTSSVALSWTAPAIDGSHGAAAGYTLQYRVTSVGGAWTQITGISGTSQTATGLSPATGYDFQVEAVNTGGASGFTATAAGTTYVAEIVLNYMLPSPLAHGSYPGVNATVTPTPANLREAWGSSATVEPVAGWTNGVNYSSSLWGCYLNGGASAAAGTVWLWLEAQDSSGATIGLSVTGPYSVT